MARTIRNLDQLIGLLNKGRFAEKCDEELLRVMEALAELPGEKGKAKITIEITIARDHELVNVVPVVKAKLPETGTFSATPFWEDGGALSVEHPNQRDMFAGPRSAPAMPVPAASDREDRERADING
jgi:hypothetical protein